MRCTVCNKPISPFEPVSAIYTGDHVDCGVKRLLEEKLDNSFIDLLSKRIERCQQKQIKVDKGGMNVKNN